MKKKQLENLLKKEMNRKSKLSILRKYLGDKVVDRWESTYASDSDLPKNAIDILDDENNESVGLSNVSNLLSEKIETLLNMSKRGD